MPRLLAAKSPSDPLPPMPLDPAQITEGDPQTTGIVMAQADDRKVSCGLWQCDPCKFEHDYEWDEFVYILQGEACVSEPGKDSYTLTAGDVAFLPKGSKIIWEIKKPLRKVFFLRTPEPLEL